MLTSIEPCLLRCKKTKNKKKIEKSNKKTPNNTYKVEKKKDKPIKKTKKLSEKFQKSCC